MTIVPKPPKAPPPHVRVVFENEFSKQLSKGGKAERLNKAEALLKKIACSRENVLCRAINGEIVDNDEFVSAFSEAICATNVVRNLLILSRSQRKKIGVISDMDAVLELGVKTAGEVALFRVGRTIDAVRAEEIKKYSFLKKILISVFKKFFYRNF